MLPETAVRTCAPADPVRVSSLLSFGAFCALTYVLIGRPQDYLPALAVLRPALVLTILTLLLSLGQAPKGAGIWRAPETRLYIAFAAVLCAGITTSIYRRASFDFLIFGYFANVVFYVMFLVHVTTIDRLKRVIVLIALSALAFNLIWITQGGFTSGRYGGSGGMFDPNDIAFVEISVLSLGVAVLLGRYPALTKLLALPVVLTAVLLALYSASRGGFIALAAWFLLFLLMPMKGISALRKVVVVIAVGALVWANGDKINVDRLSTILDVQDDYNMSAEGGRTDIWKRGLAEFAQRPLTGVGANCFAEAVGLGREREGEVGRRQTAHNSYVQVLTESGVFGGGAFLLLLLTCLRNFGRMLRKKNEAAMEIRGHAALLLIGFVGLSIGAFFLSQGYSVLFTLYFALSASLRQIAHKSSDATAAAA